MASANVCSGERTQYGFLPSPCKRRGTFVRGRVAHIDLSPSESNLLRKGPAIYPIAYCGGKWTVRLAFTALGLPLHVAGMKTHPETI